LRLQIPFVGLSPHIKMNQSGMPDMDPAKQWDWHEVHRDMAKNMYRTSYTDMIHFKEVNVKSDYPSGYGGHIPSIRHDILHRNTAYDRQIALRRNDPSRDAHPSFQDQISGIPTWCKKPQGAKKNPTYGVVPHNGTTSQLIAPWGVVSAVRPVPSYRNVPTTLQRTRSMPGLAASSGRVNQAAMSVGAAVASPSGSASAAQLQQMQYAQQAEPSPASRMKNSVDFANAESNQQRMPSEQEMLMDEVQWPQEDYYE